VSEITSCAVDENDDGQGSRQELTMTKIAVAYRAIIIGLTIVNASAPLEWRAPRDDLINRPLLHCYGGRNVCAERMSWLAPVRVARHARAVDA
jgi:hypothetical protein